MESWITENTATKAIYADTSQLILPALNFAMVMPGIYRSGYPSEMNHEFLRTLRLRTLVYLCPEDCSADNMRFYHAEGIDVVHLGIQGNKEPFVDIPPAVVSDALAVLLDVRRHPVLVHCNKGKHRTGCVVGSLRKVQRWSLTSIFDEYRRFASNKARVLDQQFIELFDASRVQYDPAYKPLWLD